MNKINSRRLAIPVVLFVGILLLVGSVAGVRADAHAATQAAISATSVVYSIYTVYVPDDLLTIQGALDAAAAVYATPAAINAANDIYTLTTIIVRDGIYTGPGNKNLDFKGVPTYLRSESGPDNCIIDCEGNGRGFDFHSGETTSSVVDGFTVKNGRTTNPASPETFGGGVRCEGSSPTIKDCIITNNSAISNGGGISCRQYSSPRILDCIITSNSVDISGGGGIFCGYNSSPRVTNCIIAGNSAISGAGIDCGESSSPLITHCTFYGNRAADTGGGILCISNYGNSAPIMIDCILWANSAWRGDELAVISNSQLSIDYSDVAGGAGDAYLDLGGLLDWGVGNIDAAPQFVSPGYWSGDVWVDGDYHLTAGSPCIDSGIDAGVYRDIDTDNRPGGLGFDMGADEYYHASVPRIGLYPTSFQNSAWVGENAQAQGLAIWNSGGGTLAYSVTDDVAWLGSFPASGTSTGEADPITIVYNTSSLPSNIYGAKITVSDPSASNSPQTVDVTLIIGHRNLTWVNCSYPPSGAVLYLAPTFTWTVDGGDDNIYAVDLSLSLGGPTFSTWENLHLRITDERWTMPTALWNRIPHGSYVYWTVRGADFAESPPIIVFSNPVWFYKP